MKTLAVFDPAMSYFDPVLVQFAADLKWVEERGVTVTRYNLGKEPQAFSDHPAVAAELEAGSRLPVIVADGLIVSSGTYPSREQLAQALGLAATPGELSPTKALACPCTPWL